MHSFDNEDNKAA